ncbi:hypothetical protein PILCRDRAFT_75064 [Piloderma croceum F 1598]|uniref:Uncharacterized protein n=1 Tax=Piloderma croceum (strain F 1598) TaxID=765440 RepID=A0A0C3AY02_PILCF|nr:hypothetical protein PILCRDRAFT_75064 [Piloderma croceum F 1598]
MDPERSDKEVHWKGQSRVQKLCHWCGKLQESGMPHFQACSRCKEVIYCVSYYLSCDILRGCELDVFQQVATFKKWHSSHSSVLRHAIICALDLGNTPSNADTKILFFQVELKPDHAQLQSGQKYHPVDGFDMTRDEARDMLGPSGGTEILKSNLVNHDHMKKKGGLGVTPLILEAHGLVDIVNIPLPRGSKESASIHGLGPKLGMFNH